MKECLFCAEKIQNKAIKCKHCGSDSRETVPIETEQVAQLGDQNTELVKALSGKYEIIREIGRGGMAVVYEAKELSLNRIVALKVLPKELTYDKQFVKRFQLEIQTLAGMTHPNKPEESQ